MCSDSESVKIRLVVGLGNPGPQYSETRHNMGFQVLDAFAAAHPQFHADGWQPKDGLLLKLSYEGEEVFLLKPMSYMNNSGFAVGETAGVLGFSPREILVVSDDIDLPLGKLRLRLNGSSGGHRGILSIAEILGSEEFPRLRVGVGRPRSSDGAPIPDYVLGRWTSDEREEIPAILETAIQILEQSLRNGAEQKTWTILPPSDKDNAENKENEIEKVRSSSDSRPPQG